MSFYVTLPCNASRDTYPYNRAGHYTTSLAREVMLDGEWEVGLAECILPVPKHTYHFEEPVLYVECGVENIKKMIERTKEIGDFEFRETLVDSSYIQTVSDIQETQDGFPLAEDNVARAFKITASKGHVTIGVAENWVVWWNDRNKRLAALLGFTSCGGMVGFKPGFTEYTAPLQFGGKPKFFFIFIYCSLVEYGYIGDSMTPCLRTIPVIHSNQSTTVLRFENPHYVPVSSSRFSEVSIEIANELGDEIQFGQGLSLIKLHFRPKKR